MLLFPATVKLFPPFLLLYPLRSRRWDMLAGTVVGLVLALGIIPLAALGQKHSIELFHDWVEVLAKPALGYGTDASRASELTDMNSTDNQSLLAVIHNWTYHILRRTPVVPRHAAPWERHTVYVTTAMLLVGLAFVGGMRRLDSRNESIIMIGVLTGLAFVASPIVHHYYYLLMMPLIAALVDRCLTKQSNGIRDWKLLAPLFFFMAVDLVARLPIVGQPLRMWGFPLLSLMYLMVTGVLLLTRRNSEREAIESSFSPEPPASVGSAP